MSQSVPSKPKLLATPLMVVVATLLLATPSLAQQQARPGEQMGMRYLSWAGKPETPAGDDLRRPGGMIPRQTAALRPAPAIGGPGHPNRYGAATANPNALTPASAWTGGPTTAMPYSQPYAAPRMPVQTPQQAPQQAPPLAMPQAQDPSFQSASAPDYAPSVADPARSIRRQDPYFAAPPQAQMAMQPTPQPTWMPAPPPTPTAVDPRAPAEAATPVASAQTYDPMAPRPDALIFRMGQSPQTNPEAEAQAQVQPQTQPAPRVMAQAAPRSGQPAREGARYYSVHREAGHQPDPMILPESIFIGGASMDLAEPPAAPIVPRTVNGRTQVVVPNQEPGLP